jgi:hypothetical protein
MNSVIRSYNIFIVLILTVFLFSSAQALAQVTFTNDQAQFLADNPGAVSQDFLSHIVPDDEFTNCNSPVNSQSNDQCFTPGFILPGIEFFINLTDAPTLFVLFGSDYRGSGSPPNVLASSFFNTSFDITFPSTGAGAVGMLLGCLQADNGFCSETLTVDVYGQNGGLLNSTTVNGTNLFNTFLGIESSEAIGRVSILLPGVGENVQGVLRIWFKLANRPIPTLSEWGMIAAAAGLMLVGVFFAVRRKWIQDA